MSMSSSVSRLRAAVALCLAAGAAGWIELAAQQAATVTADDLLAGLADHSSWLQFSGDSSGRRHSPLTQILPGKFETTALVRDGVIYATGSDNHAWAIDARTGRTIWSFRRELPEGIVLCCGRVNRGFALLGDLLYLGTLDAHLLALDRKTGAVVWDVVLADYRQAYSATGAPLVVKDKVLIGVGGGEYGIRGFIDAYDARSGERAWRFYTIPAPGEPGGESWPRNNESWQRGGASTWVTGSYDPGLNLVVWGVGNAGPQMFGGERQGDNLYAASFVALDADSGALRWHYQFTPHDVWDYDATHVPVLADIEFRGQPRQVVLNANRNGFYYVLDRRTGELLHAQPFAKTTWAKEIGSDGKPVVLPDTIPDEEGATVCPATAGATNFMTPSFDPALGLYFVTFREGCMTFYAWKVDYVPGESFRGGAGVAVPGAYGGVRALDAATGEVRWEFAYPTPTSAGVTTTASGLVFAGDSEGNFIALDSRTGRDLWHYQMGAAIFASAITYMLDGRQYVLMAAGTNLTAFALPELALP
jgi:alcohol dehydrogenase (cytochrome c)